LGRYGRVNPGSGGRHPIKLLVSLGRVFLLVYQSIALALGQIWVNKARSVLTMLGIIIGVASVAAVIAALTGLRTKVLADFESIGTNKLFVAPERPRIGPKRNASWQMIAFRPEQFERLLAECPSIKMFTRVAWSQRKVQSGDRTVDQVSIIGIDPSWHEIENRFVTDGRPFSTIDDQQGRPVCLINPQVRDKLHLDRDCVGQTILIGGHRYSIVGIVEPRPETAFLPTGESGLEILVPFSHWWRRHPGGMFVIGAARSPNQAEDARAELAFYLRRERSITPGEPDTFRIEAVEKYVQKFNQIALTITLVAAGVVGISLIVGGVGIMNIMLVSVSERTREIGLRKAVGARPSAILLQFLIEAVTLCFVGGMIGLLLGHGMAKLLSAIPGAKLDQAAVPGWAILVSFGFAASVGLIFGMFPAVKAARLDPIDALRHE
jgi:putative ABC transport system permease protein